MPNCQADGTYQPKTGDGSHTLTSQTSPSGPSNSTPHSAAAASIQLHELAQGLLYASAIRAVTVHRVADHLADGPLSADELARRSGVHAPSLRRVLRLLASKEIFREDKNGTFHLTPTAELLREKEGSQRDGILLVTDPFMGQAFTHLEETVRTGAPGFDAAHGSAFFPFLESHPEFQTLFDRGMAAFSGPVNETIVDAYPFPETGTAVDVGGGKGGFLKVVLERNPGLSGVLFDQPQTVPGHLLDIKELAGRWRVESGDFFTEVPRGGDLYFLKHILHDWDDEDSLRILRAIRAAIPDSGRLVVVDAVLPEGNDPHPGKAMDVTMLAILKGKERTEEEFRTLLQEAGFRLSRVIETESFPSLVEGVPV